MSKKNSKVHINRIICIADPSDFFGGIFECYKGSDKIVLPTFKKSHLSEYSDEENFHSVNFDYLAWREESLMVCSDIHICIYDREFRTFFKKEKVRETIVNLMVSEGDNVGTECIHYLNC